MDTKNPDDPLLRQCVPDARELEFSLGGQDDPLEEHGQMPVPGLVHRYPDRCLILTTQTCAVYCRHCNRKRLWKEPGGAASDISYFKPMMDYIAASPQIREVILSGGDPLTLPDETIDWMLGSLRSIPHVKVLRIGSRVPVVMPMRITGDICSMLRKYRPPVAEHTVQPSQGDNIGICGSMRQAPGCRYSRFKPVCPPERHQ